MRYAARSRSSPAARRLSRLIEFTDATRAEGIHARLSRWCESAVATTPGCSITRTTPSPRSYRGQRVIRGRRHGVPGQRCSHACAGHAVPLPRRAHAPRWAAVRLLGG